MGGVEAADRVISFLPLIPGALVGFSLGLTGGGGAIFAVPLLIYGLGVKPRDALVISMVTVGTTALVGFVQRARRLQVEFPTGLLFAFAGMIGTPFGASLALRLSDTALLVMLSSLMLVIAIRMWRNALPGHKELSILADEADEADEAAEAAENEGPTCRREPDGKLRFTSNCALLLAAIGLIAGTLTGLFGVGGGFIIVPALVFFSNMGMQRAIGTSLLIITIVSASAVVSHTASGNGLPMTLAGIFTLGSLMGLLAGSSLSRILPVPALQKAFAVTLVVVAVYVGARTLLF